MLHDPFRFGQSATLLLKDATYSDVQPSGSASASFTMAVNGIASGGPTAAPADAANYVWRDGESGSAFEVEVVNTVGLPTTGLLGTVPLNVTQSWSKSNTVAGTTATCTLTMTLRRVGGGAIFATRTIILNATLDATAPPPDPPGGGGGGIIN